MPSLLVPPLFLSEAALLPASSPLSLDPQRLLAAPAPPAARGVPQPGYSNRLSRLTTADDCRLAPVPTGGARRAIPALPGGVPPGRVPPWRPSSPVAEDSGK
jgi:hypothetical protein